MATEVKLRIFMDEVVELGIHSWENDSAVSIIRGRTSAPSTPHGHSIQGRGICVLLPIEHAAYRPLALTPQCGTRTIKVKCRSRTQPQESTEFFKLSQTTALSLRDAASRALFRSDAKEEIIQAHRQPNIGDEAAGNRSRRRFDDRLTFQCRADRTSKNTNNTD